MGDPVMRPVAALIVSPGGRLVAAVVAEIDRAPGPVVVVGHSGGGNVAWGAVDARPDRVSRMVFVDTVPPPPGANVGEFETDQPIIPFPGWGFFDDEDVAALRADEGTGHGALARFMVADILPETRGLNRKVKATGRALESIEAALA